jgi:hypothetical protein
MTTLPEPKTPQGGSWTKAGPMKPHPDPDMIGHGFIYDHLSGIRAISAVEFLEFKGGNGEKRFEYHLSISNAGRRANQDQVKQAVADFGMEGAEEDNHSASVTRNFWLPVGAKVAPECPCKEIEKPHDEGDGFIWREMSPRP